LIDVDLARTETASAGRFIHLNNAGAALPPRAVVDAQVAYLRLEESIGGYEAQNASADLFERFYQATASMLGAAIDEIAFVGGGSEGWWRAFTSVPLAAGDRVLVGTSEFQANAFGLLQARDRGVEVTVIPNDVNGEIDLGALDRELENPVQLVCLTMISMTNGAIHPAAEVGRRCRSHRVPFLLDACQAAGQVPLDVNELGCDFLVYTGRKFMRGPRGTGVLFAKRATVEGLGATPFVDGRSAVWKPADEWSHQPGAQRFEFNEQNFSGKIGLGVATEYALNVGIEAIASRIAKLSKRLRDGLRKVDGVVVHDVGRHQSGIVTFTLDGVESGHVQTELGRRSINVSAPGRQNTQWDLGDRNIQSVVRAGVHYYNKDDELDALVDAMSNFRRR
jgi:cysteine desulfurase/selenocysteine lyase